jgi:hypothetical protein
MIERKRPAVCDSRALKANSKNVQAPDSANLPQSQPVIDILRIRRLARAGLSIACAAVVAPFAFGEVRP